MSEAVFKKDPNNGEGLYTISPEKFCQNNLALTSEKPPKEENQELDKETLCGFGSWTPSWLQVAADPKLFLFFYSMAGLFQGAQFTYLVGCLSTLEKRFSYDSKSSGVIMIADEIVPIVFGAIVGYFGSSAHRPRLVSMGLFVGSISSFIMTVPYFLYGAGHIESSSGLAKAYGVNARFCEPGLKPDSDLCDRSATWPAVSILFFGNFLKGVAGLIFYAIGTAYLDDSVKKKNTPTYFGTLFALRLLGPTIGFLLSSLCLQFYEDPFYDPGFSPKDPRWVGAWWLGFIILGALIFLFSLPMILFPRRFPGKKLPSSLKTNKKEDPKSPMEQLKDMGKAMKRLGKNPILICHYLGGVLRLNGVVGYYVLLPKYMEMQFKQSASKASLYSGPASIIGMQIGILIGGIAIRKLKPRPRIMTGGIVIAESFSVIALIACMIITCPVHQLSGTSSITSPEFNLQNKCNEDCLCTTKTYTPVCGSDGVSTYFSPCYAGCTGYNKTDNKEVFTDCSCVHDSSGEITIGDATKGYCDSDCQWLITFVVILSLGKMLSSTARVGNALVTLRCVDPEDKSLALGALSGIFSLLAFIPYPLIYGALTDASCLVWEKSCGKTGNCWIYDTDKFRFLLHGVSAGFVFLGCITDVFVCILSPRLRDLYDDDEDTQKNTEKPVDDDEQDIIHNGGVLGVIKVGLPHNGSIGSLNGPDKDSTPM